ncbi:MAG: heavy metal translocating P-type ATPase [Beijerinckiaceae bacterium]|nr:heavy metal translocating P-type ATPase [Beijerinckiaceae bacterium]
MAEALDLSCFVRRDADGAATMDFALEGADCAACIDDIEGGLCNQKGVVSARLNVTTRRLAVVWRQGETEPQVIVERLAALGYKAHPFELHRLEAEDVAHTKWLIRCLAVASFAMMNVMLLSVSVWSGAGSDISLETRDFFHWLSALLVMPAAAYAGQPFFRSAFASLRSGRLNMDVPISLGIVLAIGMSLYETLHSAEHAYFDSAIMLMVFLLLGRTLDQVMRVKMRAAAANIAALKGDFAHRVEASGELKTVPVAALAAGDLVLVRPGDRVPADATIISGASDLDESVITGETLRRMVGEGARVWAGSLNGAGAITLRVTSAGEATLIDEVKRLVEQASEAKSRYRRLADRASAIYAPLVHLTALITIVGWLLAGASVHFALVTAISVLIITCPCALALAVPAVQVVATGSLFRAGVYLNASDAIERLAEVDHVVFDKTGTLTLPQPRVANAADMPADMLACAARLALSSRHPLAATLVRAVGGSLLIENAREVAGSGVVAMIDGVEARLGGAGFCGVEMGSPAAASDASLIFMRWGDRTCVIEIRQALRADARDVADALRARGVTLSILSGDRPEAVAPVAAALGILDWRGGVRPDEKIAAIAALAGAGRKVLMIGDGLNDAPALAGAHASISPIDAVDIARAKADAMFLGERLQPVVTALDVSRKAHALMRQNLWLAVIYNAIAVPLAIAGFVTPLIAAAAMSGSSILVTLNALRARSRRPQASAPSTASPPARPVLTTAAKAPS